MPLYHLYQQNQDFYIEDENQNFRVKIQFSSTIGFHYYNNPDKDQVLLCLTENKEFYVFIKRNSPDDNIIKNFLDVPGDKVDFSDFEFIPMEIKEEMIKLFKFKMLIEKCKNA